MSGLPLRALLITCSFALSLGFAEAKDLDSIVLPNDSNTIKIDFTERYHLQDSYNDTHTIAKPKSKKISSSLSKSFGPLKLGLKLSPFSNQGSSIRFDLDLLDTYAILSRSERMNDITQAFKPNPEEQLISSEIRSGIVTVLTALPRGIAQVAHKPDPIL